MTLVSAVLAALLAGTPEQDALEQRARAEEQKARDQEEKARADEQRERDQEERRRAEEAYERATEVLDEGEWLRAAQLFTEVARMGGRRADAALYWSAYAQSRRGQLAETLAAIEALRSSFPQSRWIKEAKALEMEARQRSGQPTAPENVADEELKLMALHGLMNSNPDEALPLLEKFLEGRQSRKLQDRALFVLSQSGSPKARGIVARVAQGESHPDLQRKAIQYLGLFGGEDSQQALRDIYAKTSDESVKKAVLHAFMVSGKKAPVLAAAKGEKDPELRRSAIHTLGVMGAQAELWEMYQAESERELRKAVLHALFVGGGRDRIAELARAEKDPELRREAIHKLGLMGKGSTDTLLAIYRGESDRSLKDAVLHALFLQGNATALVEIARNEKDPDLKKKAVHHLSLMNSKEGTQYLMELLNK